MNTIVLRKFSKNQLQNMDRILFQIQMLDLVFQNIHSMLTFYEFQSQCTSLKSFLNNYKSDIFFDNDEQDYSNLFQ